jgi:hypothetical protein
MLDGRVPLRHVEDMHIDSRLVNCPMDVGKMPLSVGILEKYRYDKLDIDPMEVGIPP